MVFFYHQTGHRSYKAVITIGIGFACVIPYGENRLGFKSFQFIFSKDKDKGLF